MLLEKLSYLTKGSTQSIRKYADPALVANECNVFMYCGTVITSIIDPVAS